MPEHDVIPAGEIHIPYNWSYADAAARLAATGFIVADVGKLARQVSDNTLWMLTDESPITWAQVGGLTDSPFEMVIACSDESTPLVTGTTVITFRMPRGVTLTAVRASLTTPATTGTLTVDINEGGSSILSTKITIDTGEDTSTTAATPPVISDAALADDAKMTVDIDDDADGTATGLKITLIGIRI